MAHKAYLSTLVCDANKLLGAVCLVTRSAWYRISPISHKQNRTPHHISHTMTDHTLSLSAYNTEQKTNTHVRAQGNHPPEPQVMSETYGGALKRGALRDGYG